MKNDEKFLAGSPKSRETFSSGLAIFFATLGSAVGLGNIWKFPYLTGANGGGAFILIYLVCIALVGVPIMVAEFYLGRKTRSNAVGVFRKLKASKYWRVIGFMGMASSFLIMFFYSAVAGWVYAYVFKAIRGDFRGLSGLSFEQARLVVESQFSEAVSGPVSPFVWQAIAISVVALILCAGVKKGIERVTKTLMPVLLVLIVVCVIRALTLEGATEGFNFLARVDFSKVDASVVLTALGLAFFKLSLGMGTMITYGSYFTSDNNLIKTSFHVALSDTVVSLLAGLAVFPVVFTFGLAPEGGPGLLFQTIPLVFSLLPFGNILLILFFLLTSIAATTAMISMVEVVVVFFTEELKMKRTTAVLLNTSVMLIVGALTVHPSSIFGSARIFGKSFFDSFDYMSSNILLPIGGLLIAIYVGYRVSSANLKLELSNQGILKNGRLVSTYHSVLRYVTPLLLFLVFLNVIGVLTF
ncbi:MAG TPA: sodium-dependent transporter [Clostridiaceae bacterium]|nr:sodium-dependent transporter [Clostridiaceae bacterium]